MRLMKTIDPICCQAFFQQADSNVALPCLSEVVSQKSKPAILGGNDSVQGHSIFTADPVEVFEFSLNDDKPFEKLGVFLSKYQLTEKVSPPFFYGGWIGFFGYELGRSIEKLPGRAASDLGFPVIRLAFYDKAVIYDHSAKRFYLTALDYRGQTQSVDEKYATLKQWLRNGEHISMPQPAECDIEAVNMNAFGRNMTESQYLEALAIIKQYIIDGDTYQINFSQRFESTFNGRAIDLYHWQNQFNPSPYSAFLSWDDKAVVSASPELFLNVQADAVQTRPIKGTRSRNPLEPDSSDENRQQFNDLVRSIKDQAELAMIVDLERNDLARICLPGTRHVTCAREIETFPTVYHAVGVVEGHLAAPAGPQRVIDILKNTFPGGSITGAPKIRSMEIIDELEPTARGVYTGSIGWIGINFDLCLNIAIRTILVEGKTAYVQTGGGIVADSEPQSEWNETLTKARALLAGIQASLP